MVSSCPAQEKEIINPSPFTRVSKIPHPGFSKIYTQKKNTNNSFQKTVLEKL
jgi:hypothetical protein